jgi:hypothetical protein
MAATKGTSKNSALSVLRIITKMISTMSQEDLEALGSGKARLTITRSSTEQSELRLDRTKGGAVDFDKLRSELGAMQSTEAGFEILDEARLTRAELERMARSLDLPVMKQDSIRRLEEKLIEALIGSRLNSRAVRGR